MKKPDFDIKWVLSDIEEQISHCEELDCHESVRQLRKHETVLRRLIREAGYDLPDVNY